MIEQLIIAYRLLRDEDIELDILNIATITIDEIIYSILLEKLPYDRKLLFQRIYKILSLHDITLWLRGELIEIDSVPAYILALMGGI